MGVMELWSVEKVSIYYALLQYSNTPTLLNQYKFEMTEWMGLLFIIDPF
jgi:hypothetical protein